MFCIRCGKEINTGIGICPFCKERQEDLINGNGFWDLCPENARKQEQKKEEKPVVETEAITPVVSKKKSKKWIRPVMGICAVLVLVILFQGFRLKKLSGNLTTAHAQILENNAEIADLNTQLTTMQENNSLLSQQLEEMEAQLTDEWTEPTEWEENYNLSIEVYYADQSSKDAVLVLQNNDDELTELEYHWQADMNDGNGYGETLSDSECLVCLDEKKVSYRCFVTDAETETVYCVELQNFTWKGKTNGKN